jgi:hypothetical protein
MDDPNFADLYRYFETATSAMSAALMPQIDFLSVISFLPDGPGDSIVG